MKLVNNYLATALLTAACHGTNAVPNARGDRALQDGTFYRYQVPFQGEMGETNCPRPIPTVYISSGSNDVELVEVSDGVTCEAQGNDLECRGEGVATFDVYESDGFFGDFTGFLLTVRMRQPESEFTCSPSTRVAQAFSLLQLCPDGSGAVVLETCFVGNNEFAIDGFETSEGTPICVSFCDSETCTADDLREIYTQRTVSGCEWEPSDITPTAPAPTTAPVSSPLGPAPTNAPSANPPDPAAPTESPVIADPPTNAPAVGGAGGAPSAAPTTSPAIAPVSSNAPGTTTREPTAAAPPTMSPMDTGTSAPSSAAAASVAGFSLVGQIVPLLLGWLSFYCYWV